MQSTLQKIVTAIIAAILMLLFFAFLLLLFPVIIFFSVRGFYESASSFEFQYKSFLNKNEGLKLFCYNNRRTSQKLIEKELIPFLPQEIKLVFLEGKKPISEFDERMISKALYSIEGGRGLPYVIKIKSGKIHHHSLHKELYDRISQDRDLNPLIDQILSF